MQKVDISGQRFGALVAKRPVSSERGIWLWEFVCDCGAVTTKRASIVKYGAVKSCGCGQLSGFFPGARFKHGEGHGRKTPEYRAWCGMKERCTNPKNQSFADYGGRGIKVCEAWANDYEQFLRDMGRKPDGCTLERLDVNAGYSKENCVWASRKTQQRNRRNTRYIDPGDGLDRPATEVAEKIGRPRNEIYIYLRIKALLESTYGLGKSD